jgi:hypothetical protein
MPDEGALEFGDLETTTWPEAEAVEGLNYLTGLELGFRLLVRTCKDCLVRRIATQLRVFNRLNL